MVGLKRGLLLIVLALTACSPAPTPAQVEAQVLTLGVMPAAERWLDVFYACAAEMPGVVLQRVVPDEAEIRVQVGEPAFVTGTAWQVGVLTLAVAVHAENPLEQLDAEQIRDLFRGTVTNWQDLGWDDLPVALWMFPPESDVTAAFRVHWLAGAPVFPATRWAAAPGALADELEADAGAVGVLPLDALTANLRAAARWDEPVLALTAAYPPQTVQQLIACVQAQSQKR